MDRLFKMAGPARAVRNFLEHPTGKDFVVDRKFEYFVYSQHSGGFLRRRS